MFHTIQYIGNQELLRREKTLFVCSKRAPWGTYERIFGWVESLTEKDVVVCCNTSELEVEVMKSLVVNQVPTILVVMNRFREENNVQIQKALKEGRMLVVVMEQTNKKRWSPRDRNAFLIEKVEHIVGGYIDKYGSLFPLLVGKTNVKALTHNFISDIVTEPDNSYQRWTVGEDKTLLRMYYEDMGIHAIKKQLNRTYLAVRERIRALTMPEDMLKGREFEELVLELLDVKSGKLLLKEWRGDKTLGEVFPENNRYPDLLIEEVETNRCIAIECKWRKYLNHTSMQDLFSPENLSIYHEFSQERDLPVFIVLGIGGTPCDPDNIYIIPLDRAYFVLTPSKTNPEVLVYEPAQLNPFRRTNTDAPLGFKEFHIEKFPPKTNVIKGQKYSSIVGVQNTYPNAYQPWTPNDDEKLIQLFQEGKTIKELSDIFGRKQGGIRSRLKLLFCGSLCQN